MAAPFSSIKMNQKHQIEALLEKGCKYLREYGLSSYYYRHRINDPVGLVSVTRDSFNHFFLHWLKRHDEKLRYSGLGVDLCVRMAQKMAVANKVEAIEIDFGPLPYVDEILVYAPSYQRRFNRPAPSRRPENRRKGLKKLSRQRRRGY